jgi:hypothetical protein
VRASYQPLWQPIEVFPSLDRYAARNANRALVVTPHGGLAREARQKTLQQARGEAGDQGRSPWLVSEGGSGSR